MLFSFWNPKIKQTFKLNKRLSNFLPPLFYTLLQLRNAAQPFAFPAEQRYFIDYKAD